LRKGHSDWKWVGHWAVMKDHLLAAQRGANWAAALADPWVALWVGGSVVPLVVLWVAKAVRKAAHLVLPRAEK
jgi:hypothetical protein